MYKGQRFNVLKLLTCIGSNNELRVVEDPGLRNVKNSILLCPLLVHCLGRTKPDIALNLNFANILTRGDKKLCGKVLLNRIAFIDCNENS